MACFGVEPGAAGWKGQTNPLSYGGTPMSKDIYFEKDLFVSQENFVYTFSFMIKYCTDLLFKIKCTNVGPL